MAHHTTTRGRMSELIAQTALLENGYSVAEWIVPEASDIIAYDRANEQLMLIQVKTLRKRDDRNGEYVLYGRKNNGDKYSKADCSHFIGVYNTEVFLIENRGDIAEYWCPADKVDEKWQRLSTTVKLNESEAV
ncbi:hypothetical protein GJU41_11800 [Bacillus idriensis]|uniref:PD(D/E)XK endonuclease domain-containing protein n=1 Tax=Metabacillus idriensis TaxID=324768 RepID=A0A6I2MC99_9BACI|nr:hypothetical protein [Metabacillus idriensis]MRX54656.1 hypothetical protein [Metabacillus idriensis]